MGQALRRASGKVASSNPKTPTKSSASIQDQNIPQVVVKTASSETIEAKSDNWDPKRDPNLEPDSLEQRDPKYDVMLNELLGRVKTKSGGVAEMGEASIAPRVNRPLPKLRKTSDIIGTGREKILAPGKLNVSQLRQILLLHKGEAENQEQPMDAKDIAEKFQLDVLIVQKILHHVSLPTESFGAEDKSN
ncbi:hypothetical protein SUGI_0016130 [Cryptomeria japonica]|uniref:uncharacterized protein LOC131026817 isoform X1 n=1 Tax=Cryptomeria japonica TaxID=3369 RepID=UPI002408CAA0|nr:uncharacterized protein LOC131026817 isoform X1 [Cryptomeria japonica]GLJ05325.1 hypothetical protein SUGI_0016130 [Cryptomeria japonica]